MVGTSPGSVSTLDSDQIINWPILIS